MSEENATPEPTPAPEPKPVPKPKPEAPKAPPVRLVVGLGNPGRKYENTRHNIGFMILDEMLRGSGEEFRNELRWQAHVAKTSSALLLKPQTFMNLSGQAVSRVVKFFKLKPQEVLVVYDDAALDFGRLRFRMKGSAGGHNGIKSMIQHLGTQDFPRLKVGIGESKPGGMVGHVLGKFRTEERVEVEKVLACAADALQVALSQGVEAAANQFNSPKTS